MHLIHLTHFFLLIFSSNFFASTLYILDITGWFCFRVSFISHLISVLLLSHVLLFLIFVQPWNLLDVNLALLERSDAFAQDLFDSRYPVKEKGIRNHAYIYVFELEYVS